MLRRVAIVNCNNPTTAHVARVWVAHRAVFIVETNPRVVGRSAAVADEMSAVRYLPIPENYGRQSHFRIGHRRLSWTIEGIAGHRAVEASAAEGKDRSVAALHDRSSHLRRGASAAGLA